MLWHDTGLSRQKFRILRRLWAQMALAVPVSRKPAGNPGVCGISDKGFYRIFRGRSGFQPASHCLTGIQLLRWQATGIHVYFHTFYPVHICGLISSANLPIRRSQGRVVNSCSKTALGVNDEARICCNGIEIPATAVAKAIGSDRRVVDATAKRILERPALRDSSSTCGQPRT